MTKTYIIFFGSFFLVLSVIGLKKADCPGVEQLIPAGGHYEVTCLS